VFHHHKELAYTVRVDKPNPVFGRMLQQAIGGPEGEMRVMNQYLFQAWGARGDQKYRDMLLHTGTEEIGHIEVLATAVAMNLDGMPSEKIDDVVTNPLVAARMGGVEPRHFLSGGLAAMPADANGVPFNAACIDVGGGCAIAAVRTAPTAPPPRGTATRDPALSDRPGAGRCDRGPLPGPGRVRRHAVAALGLGTADRDHLEPVRAGFEATDDRRRDANDVPRPELAHLVVEADAAAARHDDVRLLLLAVGVGERGADVGLEGPQGDAEVARLEVLAAEHAPHPRDAAAGVVVGFAQVHDRVVGHRAQLTSPWR
jgi:hypothetical protein